MAAGSLIGLGGGARSPAWRIGVTALSLSLSLSAACAGVWADSSPLTPAARLTIFGAPADEPARRAAGLVAQLTLQEKIGQLQNAAPAIPRMRIPAYDWWSESLHGVARNGRATVFPQSIALAAAFDEELARRVAEAVAVEARAKFDLAGGRGRGSGRYQGLTFFAPNVNIFRDPRWGRGQETYGEDPYLSARLGVAYVRGLQGGDGDSRHLRAAAVVKHFAAHSGPELTRHGFDARVDPHDLGATYLPQFEAVVREGRVAGVMAAYNRVNGVPCVANRALLEELLRRKWGFEGFVVGDCGAVQDVVRGHRFAPDDTQGAAVALRAGTDLDCGRDYRYLADAVRAGQVTEREVDRALTRLFAVRFRLGLFDPSDSTTAAAPAVASDPSSVIGSARHLALAREVAQKSMVLLENDGILPLGPGVRRIAVVGPVADDVEVLVGNYHGDPVAPVTLLAGIRAAARARGVAVDHAPGVPLSRPSTGGMAPALELARGADVIVAVLGLSPRLEGEEGDPDGDNAAGDRKDLRLPGTQPALLAALLRLGKPTVLVLTGGSAIAWSDTAPHVASMRPRAVLMAWYPGEQGGHAVADLLFGVAAPSGRLPVTFYRSTDDLPPFTDYGMAGRTYRYFTGRPLYRFGHGLGYARVITSDLRAEVAPESPTPTRAAPAPVAVTVHLQLENTGDRGVDEVVQIYAASQPRRSGDPLRSLIAFRRMALSPREKRQVTFALPASAFVRVDRNGDRQPAPGTWELTVADAAVTFQLSR